MLSLSLSLSVHICLQTCLLVLEAIVFVIDVPLLLTVQLFKMEDVSMGMWVEQFNSSLPVEYSHSEKFCQFGCIEDYYTAHYQSPKQMICLWDKLHRQGKAHCCNMR